jgi:hypothetical protein
VGRLADELYSNLTRLCLVDEVRDEVKWRENIRPASAAWHEAVEQLGVYGFDLRTINTAKSTAVRPLLDTLPDWVGGDSFRYKSYAFQHIYDGRKPKLRLASALTGLNLFMAMFKMDRKAGSLLGDHKFTSAVADFVRAENSFLYHGMRSKPGLPNNHLVRIFGSRVLPPQAFVV